MCMTLRVFVSKNQNHLVLYVARTEDGWAVDNTRDLDESRRAADKTGHPWLYHGLRHQCIQYPAALPICMKELWEKAESGELDTCELQTRLQQLGDWISEVEKATPSTGFWAMGRTAPDLKAGHDQGTADE